MPDVIKAMTSFNLSAAASGSSCCADDWLSARQDYGWRNRSASCVDLDDLIGTVLKGIAASPQAADSTYVIFTSDNGYHIGKKRKRFKM